MPALHTFDVFDTAITRIVGEPVSAFLLLGQTVVADGIWPGSAEQFAAARVAVETRARVHAGWREVRFAAIYDELRSAYALTAAATERIARAELALERCLLRPVPEIGRRIDAARRRGDTVQFVSDMYLPHDVVQGWLVELGVARAGDVVWMSSEHGVTKGGGGLFDVVAAAKPAGEGGWVHEGDNARSDVAVPAARGIAARHFTDGHLTADERAIESFASSTCGLASLLAGAARWVRLGRPEGHDATLHEVASGIAAPVVYAFVHWVLLEATRRGLRKIWFMARDGQVMLPVARSIATRLGLDVELGYLYGGRQVVRVASLVAIDAAALVWLTGGAGMMTLQAVLDRVGVAVDDVRAVADELGLPTETTLGWESMDALKRFLQDPRVAPRILAEAAVRRATVLAYFRRCGLIGDETCAVVDIGWKGNVLRSIVDLIGIAQAARHTFLYFGSYGYAESCRAVPRLAYLFDVRDDTRSGTGDDIPSMTTLMEIICQADHGSVMRLERHGDRFEPVCRADAADDAAATRWHVPRFQRAIADFAETVPIERFASITVDLRGLCDRLLRRLAVAPTPAEVALLAPIGFVDDQGGSQPQPFAHAYGWEHVRAAYRSGTAAPQLGLNWWRAAAVSMTPEPVRWCMRAAAKARRVRTARLARPSGA